MTGHQTSHRASMAPAAASSSLSTATCKGNNGYYGRIGKMSEVRSLALASVWLPKATCSVDGTGTRHVKLWNDRMASHTMKGQPRAQAFVHQTDSRSPRHEQILSRFLTIVLAPADPLSLGVRGPQVRLRCSKSCALMAAGHTATRNSIAQTSSTDCYALPFGGTMAFHAPRTVKTALMDRLQQARMSGIRHPFARPVLTCSTPAIRESSTQIR
jgi:hypothetical protein